MYNLNETENKSDKALVALLKMCKSKEQSRYAINKVYVDYNRIVATDGRCLFLIEYTNNIIINKLKDAFTGDAAICALKGNLLVEDMTEARYPNYTDCIPTIKHNDSTTVYRNVPELALNNKGLLDGFLQDITLVTGARFNRVVHLEKQLLLIGKLGNIKSATIYQESPKKPLRFDFGYGDFKVTYLVTPITIDVEPLGKNITS